MTEDALLRNLDFKEITEPEIVLAGMPVTDRVLEKLGNLKKNQSVHIDLSFCHDISPIGLNWLNKDPNLKSLDVLGCAGIDFFSLLDFQSQRPDVAIQFDTAFDPELRRIAFAEASKDQTEPQALLVPQYWAVSKLLNVPIPLLEFPITPEMERPQRLVAERYLQNLKNGYRALYAIGASCPQPFLPRTIPELLDSLSNGNRGSVLDLTGLGMTDLPSWFFKIKEWPELELIKGADFMISLKIFEICPKVTTHMDATPMNKQDAYLTWPRWQKS